MIAVLLLACLGLVLNIIGRWNIIRAATGLSHWWRWALWLLPGAELAFIVHRGERARGGSILCALSIALMLPMVGQMTIVLRNTGYSPVALLFDVSARETVFKEGSNLRSADETARRERALQLKEAKVRELGDYLERWHVLLAERRDNLCDETGEETRRFNEDAAAYHALLAAARVELAEWKGLAKGRDHLAIAPGIEP